MRAYPIVRESDRNAGIIASALTLLLLFIYLYFTTIFMADPSPRDIPIKTETTLDELELKDLVIENPGGQGGGTPSNDPLDEPKPQSQKVLTKPKNPRTQTNSGESTNDNNPVSNNPSSSTQVSNNPFGDGGSGGGKGGGKGGGFGSDEGNKGTGHGGKGDGSGRIRLNDPKVDHIETDIDLVINLKLTISSNGEVIAATNIASKTTTTDQRIINQVISAVKNQVRYNKDSDAGLVSAYLTVKVNAH
jgi:hypothetical protein